MKSIETLIIDLGKALSVREWKLAIAESCTGGGLAYALTSLSGSSSWFDRGFVTYSDSSKAEILDVPSALLTEFGAVSEEVARKMAEGTLKHSHAQVSLAITGIAGPAGGSPEKPVGSVWFAWADINRETQVSLSLFEGDRQTIRQSAIEKSLLILLDFLKPS